MKVVNLNLNIISIPSGQQPIGDRLIPRVNVFKDPYTLPENQEYLIDDNNNECLDLTQTGVYNYKFNLNEYEICGVDIIHFLGNNVLINNDYNIIERQHGTVKTKQIIITDSGNYNIDIAVE